MTTIDFETVVPKLDAILARGLSRGMGTPLGRVCVEAAVCMALGLPHGDDPGCVNAAVRSFKISLNDALWSTPKARAAGLRKLAIAQLGSKGAFTNEEFNSRVSEKLIRRLLPSLFREVFTGTELADVADLCEIVGTSEAVQIAVSRVWYYLDTGDLRFCSAARNIQNAADCIMTYPGTSCCYAAEAATDVISLCPTNEEKLIGNKYLLMGAEIALEVLTELKSPGVEWLALEAAKA